jgi:quercetin dioxygenase-like cupin family protein
MQQMVSLMLWLEAGGSPLVMDCSKLPLTDGAETTQIENADRLAKDYLKALTSELTARSGDDPSLAPFRADLLEVAHGPVEIAGPSCTLPVFRESLAAALAAMPSSDPIYEAVSAIVAKLAWYQVYQGADLDPMLAERMFAGQVVGQVGLLKSDNVRTGLFLLVPGLHYPMHTHAASEIYFCLSGSVTLQYGLTGVPFDLRPGEISVTQSNHVHSLTTGLQPTLLVYQWIGDVDSPNWWWEKRSDGKWWQEKWVRQDDGSWAAEGVEPVPQDEVSAMA